MFNQNSSTNKARVMNLILYTENMIEDWEVKIDDVVQVPFAYCKHDMDTDSKSEYRKDHVHLMLAFSNTTTLNHAMNVANMLSAPGQVCCSTCQAAVDVRRSYDYLIHDTESCRKQGKYQYPAEARITGNNFDIGLFEQMSMQDRVLMVKELCDFIMEQQFVNISDFYLALRDKFSDDWRYMQLLQSYSGLFERLCKGNFLRFSYGQAADEQHIGVSSQPLAPRCPSHSCCPECGSVNIRNKGKTRAGSQRWLCKDCGKYFSETSKS